MGRAKWEEAPGGYYAYLFEPDDSIILEVIKNKIGVFEGKASIGEAVFHTNSSFTTPIEAMREAEGLLKKLIHDEIQDLIDQRMRNAMVE